MRPQWAVGALGFVVESLACAAAAGLGVFVARWARSGNVVAALSAPLCVWWMPLLLLGLGFGATALLKGVVRRWVARRTR
ncbi:MAG: hypothetical protein AB1778_05725 [Candidatus Bipolaricaulota bacterium]